MLYLCLFESQNNDISNAISIYIRKSCSRCSQDPIRKVDGVQCPDSLACGKNRTRETCSTWGTSGHPQWVPQNLHEGQNKRACLPHSWRKGKKSIQTGATCSGKWSSSPGISSDWLWDMPSSCCASFSASLYTDLSPTSFLKQQGISDVHSWKENLNRNAGLQDSSQQ